MANCALCQKSAKLCNSHILPEFLYAPCYDEGHNFISIPVGGGSKTQVLQKGVREYMLCAGCEGRFGTYESYVANLLRTLYGTAAANKTFIIQKPFDYRLLKLCALSILWRCHVSQQSMFRHVDLGPHAETIRQMLLQDDPGNPRQYAVALYRTFTEAASPMAQIIMMPNSLRLHGMYAYTMMAQGFQWVFIVSSHFNSVASRLPFIGMEGPRWSSDDLVLPVVGEKTEDLAHYLRREMSKEQLEHTDAVVDNLKTRTDPGKRRNPRRP